MLLDDQLAEAALAAELFVHNPSDYFFQNADNLGLRELGLPFVEHSKTDSATSLQLMNCTI